MDAHHESALEADQVPARVYWIPVVVTMLCVLAGLALVWSVRADLPDPLVTHWGANGEPNGYTPLRTMMVTDSLITLALCLPLLGLGVALKQARSMAVVTAGTAAFLGCVLFGGTWAQRGHTTEEVGGVVWLVLAGLVSAIIVGGLVWLAVRAPKVVVPAGLPLPSGAPVLDDPGQGRIVWTGRLVRGRGTYWFFFFAVLPLLAMAVLFAALGNWGGAALMGVLTLVIVVPFQMMFARIVVDARGLRSAGPIRWVNLPLATILSAEVSPSVSPMGDFGGYGLRGGFDGSNGLVTAEGPALLVRQAGRGPMYITVDDPAMAAATVNTLVKRARGQG